MPDLRDEVTDALGDRYVIKDEVGRGGTAVVYLARDVQRGSDVALKVLRPEATSAIGTERFAREIRLTARLNHPNILPILDSGDVAGVMFYTMPNVGQTLAQRLRQEPQLPVGEALRIAGEVADALEYAHAQGVIHRDIKPSNVLMTHGHAMLADFGIARSISRDAESLTDSGLALGTAHYMSPEQATSAPLDGRSDVYALGCLLYEMLAGAPPFDGPTVQSIMARHAVDPMPSLRTVRASVTVPLEGVIRRAMAKSPADRFATAAEFKSALLAAASHVPASGLSPRARAAAALVIAAVAIAIALRDRWPWTRSNLGLDRHLVAIAPFTVPEAQLAIWREGLAELVSRNLDGAGLLRTVSPTTVMREVTGNADAEVADRLARRSGAATVMYGSLLRSGPDSVRLQVTIHDAIGRRSLPDIELREATDHIDRLADRLTIEALRRLGESSIVAEARMRSGPSVALSALKAFLQGETFFRRTAWDSALIHYQRAIELDSTLALGYLRASETLDYRGIAGDSLSRVYIARAGALNRGLAPRESLLIAAAELTSRVSDRFADPSYNVNLRRLLSTLDVATTKYADEREAWLAYGSALEQFTGSARRALYAYDRAIAADSGFAPAYRGAVTLAMAVGGAALGVKYLDGYLRLRPDAPDAPALQLARAYLNPSARLAQLQSIVDTASAELLVNTLVPLAYWPDSGETSVRLARLFGTFPHTQVAAFRDSTFVLFQMAYPIAFRGHLREAFTVLGDRPMQLARRPGSQYLRALIASTLVMMNAVSREQAAAYFDGLRKGPVDKPTGLILALPWWAETRDLASLTDVANRASAAARAATDSATAPYARYVAGAARAYLALARHDSNAALDGFRALQPADCMHPYCPYERLLTAKLLTARGRNAEAMTILEDVPYIYNPLMVLFRYERARVAERLGRRDDAVAGYSFVSQAWMKADSTLQGVVQDARAGLARLGR